ncbi:MAG: alpha/beta fold hydrolase [Verrucomicrobiota bacterium]
MQYLDMPWGRMGYTCAGKSDRAPFVFLHGTGCNMSDWNDVTAALCAGGPLVRVDFRGHGASDVARDSFVLSDLADDVILLVNGLGLQDVVLVGHSLGGMVALEIASRSPWIKALVLLEGWTSLRAANAFAGERFYGQLPSQAVEQIQKKATATRARFATAVWNNFWASVQAFDAAPILARMAMPVFEVYGSMGKTEATRGILAIPDRSNIKICWIADAGHYLPQERPADVAAICMRAARGSPAGMNKITTSMK